MPQPTFAYEATSRILQLAHPKFIAEWTVRETGRIDFTSFQPHDGPEWIAPQLHEPIALVGVAGYGNPFHVFDAHRIPFEDQPDIIERTGTDLMENGLSLTLPCPGQQRKIDGLGFVRASEVIHLTQTSTNSLPVHSYHPNSERNRPS